MHYARGTHDASLFRRKEVKDMLELLQRHLGAYAAADWAGYKADLAPDVVYEEIPTGTRAIGPDAYVEAVKAWKVAFPDSKGTIQRFTASGDIGVAEFEWGGAHKGALETPFGSVPATNQKVLVPSVLIAKVEDGKLIQVRLFFDMLNLLRQIGYAAAIPAKPTEAKPAVLH
jgi:steroid delta-isomerase-like uncharacterized protein